MNIKSKVEEALKHTTDCLVVGHFEGEKLSPTLSEIDKALKGTVKGIIAAKSFRGKTDETYLLHTYKALPAKSILLIGLGKKKDFTLEKLRRGGGKSATAVRDYGISTFSTLLADNVPEEVTGKDAVTAITEGTLLSLYAFNNYKTDDVKEIKKVKGLTIVTGKPVKGAKEAVIYGTILAESVSYARDLVNHPSNKVTPTYLANEAKKIAKELKLKCAILDKAAMNKMGMGSLLSVAKGSEQEPKFITLQYDGGKKGVAPTVVVGKAVTFDSGGISLKHAKNMDEMKMDMSGGAAAIAAIAAAAKLKLKVNLVSIIPAVENMPSGRASKPGDIVKSMNGKTIEITNTDAEGRLILADALTYAERYKPAAVIDLATLTGAVIVALGHFVTAVLGNDDALIKNIKKAGEASGERVWELPLWEEYDKLLKSDIADIKNSGTGQAGTITGASFLKNFTSKYKWAHLDIAGTAWDVKGNPYLPKGATGVGVRLLIEYLKNI
ncbi:MAG: leucyl aminopeptidase [Nitrospinota bacterium]|nr:leucyl aminopeptidase [Nitrospinota bacterium]